LAFRDRDYGPLHYFEDPTEYAAEGASKFCRFISMYWGHIERGGPGHSYRWNSQKTHRLNTIIAVAHASGYRLRFYTLNARQGGPRMRFPKPAIAHDRWRRAAFAGADWIATDEYEDIVAVLHKES